tara:strand:- start:2690 stop:2899 length:210 start_codon:yes stop_codon:yes gene_type:complete
MDAVELFWWEISKPFFILPTNWRSESNGIFDILDACTKLIGIPFGDRTQADSLSADARYNNIHSKCWFA